MWMDSFRHFVRRIRPRRQCKCGNVKPRFVVRQNVVKTMNEYDQVNSHGLNENKSLRREGDTLNRLQTHAEHTGRRSTVMRCIYIYVSSQPFPAHQPLLHSFILELITHLSWILCFDRPWPPRPRSCCCSSCWFRAACSLSRRRGQWRETSGGGSRAACCWGLCNMARCRHRDLRVAPTTLYPRPALFARDAMR